MYVCIYIGITPCRCVCADICVCVCMCTIHVYIMCFLFFYDVETICDFIEGFSDVWEDGHVHVETHTQTPIYIYVEILYVYIYLYIDIYNIAALFFGCLLQLLLSIYPGLCMLLHAWVFGLEETAHDGFCRSGWV